MLQTRLAKSDEFANAICTGGGTFDSRQGEEGIFEKIILSNVLWVIKKNNEN